MRSPPDGSALHLPTAGIPFLRRAEPEICPCIGEYRAQKRRTAATRGQRTTTMVHDSPDDSDIHQLVCCNKLAQPKARVPGQDRFSCGTRAVSRTQLPDDRISVCFDTFDNNAVARSFQAARLSPSFCASRDCSSSVRQSRCSLSSPRAILWLYLCWAGVTTIMLINLIPIPPLDGNRIVSISPVSQKDKLIAKIHVSQ